MYLLVVMLRWKVIVDEVEVDGALSENDKSSSKKDKEKEEIQVNNVKIFRGDK